MSNTQTAEKVHHHSTGVADLDALLADATPETVTAALVMSRLSFMSNPLGDEIMATLEEQVDGYRKGKGLEGRCELAEIQPTLAWINLLDRLQHRFEVEDIDACDEFTEPEPTVKGARRRCAVLDALRAAHGTA